MWFKTLIDDYLSKNVKIWSQKGLQWPNKSDVRTKLLGHQIYSVLPACPQISWILKNRFLRNQKVPFFQCRTTGCPVSIDFFQEPLIGTSIPQLLMTNDSFSSQTWAISVPNRNSDVKSISWPTGPPRVRSQNKGYWQYSTI